MKGNRILLGNFEFNKISGLEYLFDENNDVTDYLFVKSQHGGFSMYFEDGFPPFTVPENTDRPYCLFEIKRPDRAIKFYCPEKRKNLDEAVWYFYVEIVDSRKMLHRLIGQVTVSFDPPFLNISEKKPKFIEVLENVKLNENAEAV
jgi:hypothetical protein